MNSVILQWENVDNMWGFKKVVGSEKFTRDTIASVSEEGGLTN